MTKLIPAARDPYTLAESFISAHRNNINLLSDEGNVVLAGSIALALHGLSVWHPEDIDIIIFNPSQRQIDIVKNESLGWIKGGSGLEDEILEEEVRSYSHSTLNVILERILKLPNGLLRFHSNTIGFIYVNSVANIIDAKCSYSAGKDKRFLRGKDVQHLQFLKNKNFNY